MNNFRKYCPNVFVAACDEQHEKGATIELTTKYGKAVECEVFNYLGQSRKDGKYLYSIQRLDGVNHQTRAAKKAEKLKGYAANAEKRSSEAYNSRATQQELDFMRLGEPIKVGHHSEGRHRRMFERYDNKMRKSIEESDRAKEYERRAEYWESRKNDINLSMLESLEYYEFKLHEAKQRHEGLKNGTIQREHSFSLTYAKKNANELTKKLETAVKLWGSDEEINQIAAEKKEEAETKTNKNEKFEALRVELGGFFAFNTDQFNEGIAAIKSNGILEEGEKVTHVKAGLYVPSKNVKQFIAAI